MIWSLVASALGQNQQNSAQNAAIKEQEKMGQQQNAVNMRQNISQAQNEIQGMNAMKQQAFMKQQSVLDEIMQKYRIGGM
jgi:hypothetical protein